MQIEEFASDLKDYQKNDDDLAPLIKAWSNGQAGKLAALMNAELVDQPDVKKALLTDRNRRWALQIETMLREKRYFSSPWARAILPVRMACRLCSGQPDTRSKGRKSARAAAPS